ncbi:MAG: ATP synthase F1 subunit delta [Acidobacteria bacterium]|nr:MAG: ATP synthase F1 subunit delta [Acidobacteriota bacterium]
MAKLDEKHVAIARVYSRAMLDLAEQQGAAESLLEELEGLLSLLAEQPVFAAYLASPVVEISERQKTIERLLRGRASDLLVDALQVLNQHGRLPVLETVVATYRSAYQARRGEVDVFVATAVPLDDDVRAAVRRLIVRHDGRRPNLIEKVEPSLLGGLVLRIDDRKIDTSVAKDLRTIRARLAERGSLEILSGRLRAAAH